MKTTTRFIAIAIAALALPAQAHITLEQASAPAGAYQKLTFRVGHGCDGSATKALTVTLPDSVIGAKPMPKALWNVSTVDARLATPVESHGKTIVSAVREVTWQGEPLPDAQYDEFSMQVKLPATPGKLYFKVAQVCQLGRMDWDQVPAGADATLKAPAPALELLPAAAPGHVH
ncbi:uncharacterized protein YcnI [Oxalobacteraceae bacterium GrIS 1.11]